VIKYLIIFTLVGFLLSKFIKDEKNTFIAFLAVSVIWGLSSAPIWGLVTFGELSLGFALSKVIGKE